MLSSETFIHQFLYCLDSLHLIRATSLGRLAIVPPICHEVENAGTPSD